MTLVSTNLPFTRCPISKRFCRITEQPVFEGLHQIRLHMRVLSKVHKQKNLLIEQSRIPLEINRRVFRVAKNQRAHDPQKGSAHTDEIGGRHLPVILIEGGKLCLRSVKV